MEIKVRREMEEKKKHRKHFQFLQKKKTEKEFIPRPPLAVMFLPLWFLEPDVSSSQFLATEP